MGEKYAQRPSNFAWLEGELSKKMEGAPSEGFRASTLENALTRLASSYFRLSIISDERPLLASKQELLAFYSDKTNLPAAGALENKLSALRRINGAPVLENDFYGTMHSWSRVYRALSSNGAMEGARMATHISYSNARMPSRIDERWATCEDLHSFFCEGEAVVLAPYRAIYEIAKIMVPFVREGQIPLQIIEGEQEMCSFSIHAISDLCKISQQPPKFGAFSFFEKNNYAKSSRL